MEQSIKKLKKEVRKSYVSKLWIAGNCSSTVIIPKRLAELYNMNVLCHVSFEPYKEGIIIRKVGNR